MNNLLAYLEMILEPACSRSDYDASASFHISSLLSAILTNRVKPSEWVGPLWFCKLKNAPYVVIDSDGLGPIMPVICIMDF